MTSKTQYRLNKLFKLLRHYLRLHYHKLFNTTVRRQLKDHKCIPIIIISFNQLYYLKRLVSFLISNGYTNIIIIDNNSTYPPLLDYLKSIENTVTLYRLSENLGHLAYWKKASIYDTYNKGYYVVTDADIVPDAECPDVFLETFRVLLDKAYDRTKVGFSLKLDGIPDTNPNKARILNWESKFYKTRIHPLAFKAEIDTTFALYRPGYNYKLKDFTKAWRTDIPLQASHGGWYIDIDNLTEEQYYYMKTANASASWQINNKGELINKVHKPLYEK